ncbi:unknown [Clostridium sp. CAG:609]|nr:unknown [Clostridium sp. CAG:609]
MKEYLKVSKKLAKKQIIESIELEIIYEFIILKSKEMIITKIDTIYIFSKEEYLSMVDDAIAKLNNLLTFKLKRDNNKIILG